VYVHDIYERAAELVFSLLYEFPRFIGEKDKHLRVFEFVVISKFTQFFKIWGI
jgi:hypothetical protein